MPPVWEFLHPKMTLEHLGMLPEFLNENNPQSAKEQIDGNYRHGGGWHSMKGFKLGEDNSLSYPGDPPMSPVASTRLRDELILLYPHAWIAIIQPDRSFDVARID